MDRKKFKNIVGVDSLDKVISGIEKMLEITDCLIKINMVVMKDNINEVTKFIDYAPDQFIGKVEKIKEIFNQHDILMNTIECSNFRVV